MDCALTKPGSDPGAFCLARCGLYVREADCWIVFLVFRGNDLHSGFAPTSPPIPISDINALGNAAGPNRVVYVKYPSRVATTRAGSMSMSPPTNFWNYGSSSVAKTEQRHYTDASSTQVFGSLYAKVNRLAREASLAFSNALTYSGVNLNITLTDLLTGMTYTDENGQTQNVKPPRFDIARQAAEMSRWWRFYEWHQDLCATFLIRMTKDEFRRAHQRAQQGVSTDASTAPYTALSRVPATVVPHEGEHPAPGASVEHLVDSVVQRKMINGKVRHFFFTTATCAIALTNTSTDRLVP